jgi:hypothetical protein
MFLPARILAPNIVANNQWGNPPNVRAIDFGVVGDGIHDDTAAVIEVLRFLSFGTVDFTGLSSCLVSASIPLRSGINLKGAGGKFTYAQSWANFAAFLVGRGLSNITIDGIIFDGLGVWTNVAFPNPYTPGNSVGFTNSHKAIEFVGCTDTVVQNCEAKGLGFGVDINGGLRITVANSNLHNLGQVGVRATNIATINVRGSTISGVLGNLTAPGDVDVDHSAFADGVYLYDVTDATIEDNPLISDIVRIGIVLESDLAPRNTNVVIQRNVISNLHSCRNGQTNAAVWCEPGNSIATIVRNNTFDNTGAVTGDELAQGVHADACVVRDNSIRGFAGAGVSGGGYDVFDNVIEGNGWGIVYGYGLTPLHTVSGNNIAHNLLEGVVFTDAHMNALVYNNTFIDNGLRNLPGSLALFKSGISINHYYNDQHITIDANTFLTTANEGDTFGQLYAISGVTGGDLPFTKNGIVNNVFSFLGSFGSPYPAKMSVAPCSFAHIDGGTGVVTVDEILNVNGNINGKIP